MVATHDSTSGLFRRARAPKIRRSELLALSQLLKSANISLGKFGEAVASYPAVLHQLLRAANSSLTGSATQITAASHAALFLGERRVEMLLATLPKEIIEEDTDASQSSQS